MNFIKKSFLADAALILAAALWGSAVFVFKDVISELDYTFFLALRFLLAFVTLVVLCLFLKKNVFGCSKAGLYLGCIFAAANITQIWGLHITEASNSGFFSGLSVLFTPLLAWIFFQHQMYKNEIIAFVLAFAGLWIFTGGMSSFNMGDLLSLVSALFYSIYFFVGHHFIKQKGDPLVLNAHMFFVSMVACGFLMFFFNAPMNFTYVVEHWFLWIYIIAFVTVIPFFLILWAQHHTTPVKTSFLLCLEMLFAGLFAWTLGHEPFTIAKGVGGLVLFVSVIYAQRELIKAWKTWLKKV